ncbi:MAG: UDP-N-acetylglucosamine 1-carboxyvinyltransferase [Trueperaceae bacterium]
MQQQGEALFIQGGTPLRGEVHVNTAKNSALYLILASLLTREPVRLHDIPRLSDVLVALEILEHVGVEVRWEGRDLHLHAADVHTCGAPYSLVSKMRASFVAMGALLARCGRARISMPGGCAFGPRPVDRHIAAFQALGVQIDEEGGDFHAFRGAKLAGRVEFEAPTVGGTQNVLLATALAGGRVTIVNAALEPEIADLANMLNAMGARISGAETGTIEIEGVSELSGVDYRPLPDRIEAGTLMLATAATRGTVTLRGINASHLEAVSSKLRETGVRIIEAGEDGLLVDASGDLQAVDVTAAEYPEIPTDLQAPFSAYLATLPGASVVRDRVYPDRFTHVDELRRTGADVELFERTLIIRGGRLAGARMHAADIRAGGALVIAALGATGTSVISGLQYVDRGYEALTERLVALGAKAVRKVASSAPAVAGD